MNNPLFQEQFLRQAYLEAKNSPDLSNQNGAYLQCNELLCKFTACNEFPFGIEVTRERLTKRPEKYFYVEHAERNVLFKACATRFSTQDSILVCPWAACADCARAMICTGVRLLVVHKQRQEQTPERWKPDVEIALSMLKEAGVEIIEFDGPVPTDPILVNGRMWNPGTFEYASGEDTSNITMKGSKIA